MTDPRTVVTHLASDEAVAVGHQARRYLAVCWGRGAARQPQGTNQPVLPQGANQPTGTVPLVSMLDGSAVNPVNEWLALLRVTPNG